MRVEVRYIGTTHAARLAGGGVEHETNRARWMATRDVNQSEWLIDYLDFDKGDADDWYPYECAIQKACENEEAVYDRNYAAGMERCECGRWMAPTEGKCVNCGRNRDDEYDQAKLWND